MTCLGNLIDHRFNWIKIPLITIIYSLKLLEWHHPPHPSGNVYDNDRNIIDFGGSIVQSANSHLKQHANGKLNSRTAEPFTPDFKTVMENLDCSQLLNETVADVSTIRGVKLR